MKFEIDDITGMIKKKQDFEDVTGIPHDKYITPPGEQLEQILRAVKKTQEELLNTKQNMETVKN